MLRWFPALALSLFGTLASSCAPAAAPIKTAERLPSLELSALDARHVNVTGLVAGKPALVSFWATWCTACEQEFDALNRLDALARRRGAVVLGIAVGEEPATVAAFVRRRGLAYPQLVDEDFHFADALGQRKVPTTLVLDGDGRVVFTGGVLDERAIASFRKVSER